MAKKMPAARGGRALSAQRAWEIAVEVANPIRGSVQLTRGHNSVEEIDPSGHEWLDITLPHLKTFPRPRLRHALEWVVRARETCVVWHMLACCEGFSGHENERFWKRLVDEAAHYHPDDPRSSRARNYHVSDEYPLSPTPPAVTGLPRFRLVFQVTSVTTEEESDRDEGIVSADWWVDAIRAFAGIGDTTARSSSTVQGYVAALLPHVDETTFFEHAVEICFEMTSVPRRNVTNSIQAVLTDVETHGRETTPAQRKSDLLAGTIRFPVVTFKEFALELFMLIESDDVVAELQHIIATVGNIVTFVEVELVPGSGQMSEDVLSAFLEVLRHPPSRTFSPVQHLAFYMNEASQRQREIIFSSLPTIRVPSLSVDGPTANDQTLNKLDWAWLAFGLYHPSARFLKLDIFDLDLSERSASPMKSIASAHASLYRLYYGEPDDTVPQEDATDPADVHYTVVTIRASTTCYESASLQGKPLCELKDETTLTAVVKYAMRDVDQLPTVVCVVVPTRGHGWIPRTSITSLSWLRSSGASIQHIVFGTLAENPLLPLSSIGPLLYNVASLDLKFWPELSALQLLEVLRACPGLKRLHIQHRGELWHDWDENTAGDDAALKNLQLQALSMTSFDRAGSFRAPSKTAWNTCLRQLSRFHISTSSSTNVNKGAVRDAFQQGCTVEQFVWSTRSRFGSDKETTFEKGCANTRKLLKIRKGKNDKAQLPFSVEARLAFASAIKRKGEEKDDPGEARRRLRPRRAKQRFEGLGKLSEDIAQLICEFATTDVERRAWVYC